MKKIKFAIYNYNFLRIIEPNKQLQMEFPDWQVVDVEESFRNRQYLLGDILLSDYNTPYQFENAKKKKYWHVQVVKPQDEVYVMRVANVTNVTITDEHLKAKNYADYRNCLVIIDNRPGIQRIAIERKTKRSLMSGFHGGYSLGTLIGAGAMSVLFTLGIIPAWAVVICTLSTLLAMAFGCRDLLSKEDFATDVSEERSQHGRLFIPTKVIVVGLLCFIMYASEGAVMGWSALFVSQERGVDVSLSGYFYTAFAVSMTLMRLCGDKVVSRFGQRQVVSMGALLVAVGFIVVVLVDSALGAVAGFAMVGCGAANIVPQLVSFAARIKGMAVHHIISFINALGYSGILVGPVIIGFIGKHYGLHVSFLGIAAFALVVAVVSSIIFSDSRKKTNRRFKTR